MEVSTLSDVLIVSLSDFSSLYAAILASRRFDGSDDVAVDDDGRAPAGSGTSYDDIREVKESNDA